MSKERELLKAVWEDLDGDRNNYNGLCEKIEELLAQPEQDIGYAQALLEEYDKGFNDAKLSLPKREPLSYDDRMNLWNQTGQAKELLYRLHDYAVAIEKAHGIGGADNGALHP